MLPILPKLSNLLKGLLPRFEILLAANQRVDSS